MSSVLLHSKCDPDAPPTCPEDVEEVLEDLETDIEDAALHGLPQSDAVEAALKELEEAVEEALEPAYCDSCECARSHSR